MDIEHSNHEQIAELAAAYALDALEPDEMRAMEEHMRTCPSCRTAVAEMRSVVAMLPYTVEPVEPPPALKQQLFERIHAEAQPAPVPFRTEADPRTEVRKRRGGFWSSLFTNSRLPVLASVASLVLALGMGWVAWQQHNRAVEAESQLARLSEVHQITTAYQTQVAQMRHKGMQARLYVVPNHSEAYIVIAGLPELPPGRSYQIWLKPPGENAQPVSAGVFDENTGKWLLEANRPVNSYDWIGITVEPEGGSPRPTSEPLMGGDLN